MKTAQTSHSQTSTRGENIFCPCSLSRRSLCLLSGIPPVAVAREKAKCINLWSAGAWVAHPSRARRKAGSPRRRQARSGEAQRKSKAGSPRRREAQASLLITLTPHHPHSITLTPHSPCRAGSRVAGGPERHRLLCLHCWRGATPRHIHRCRDRPCFGCSGTRRGNVSLDPCHSRLACCSLSPCFYTVARTVCLCSLYCRLIC